MRIKGQSCPDCGRVPCKQCLPACLCSVLLKWPTREDWEEITLEPAVSAPALLQTLAYFIVKAAKQASSGSWGHCWPGTASELGTCTGMLHLPSSCRNLSSHPWEAGTKKVHLHPLCISASVWSSTVNRGFGVRFWLVRLILYLHPLFCCSCLCWAISAVETATECTVVLGLVQQAAKLPSQGSQECWREDRNCYGCVLSLPLGAQGSCLSPKLTISVEHTAFLYVLVYLKPFLY